MLAAAMLVVALGCGKHESKLDTTGSASSTGSATGSGSSAVATGSSSATGSGSAVSCDDADIQKHIDDSLAASLAYLGELEKRTATWTKDCEAAKKDLLALEPQATKFMDAMMQFISWGRALPPECGRRIAELGEKTPAAKAIEARTPGIEAKVKPILEACQSKPGFTEAAQKGLRLMRSKRSQ
jgi:hypothetical protein